MLCAGQLHFYCPNSRDCFMLTVYSTLTLSVVVSCGKSRLLLTGLLRSPHQSSNCATDCQGRFTSENHHEIWPFVLFMINMPTH